jgi:hypothetical protein
VGPPGFESNMPARLRWKLNWRNGEVMQVEQKMAKQSMVSSNRPQQRERDHSNERTHKMLTGGLSGYRKGSSEHIDIADRVSHRGSGGSLIGT